MGDKLRLGETFLSWLKLFNQKNFSQMRKVTSIEGKSHVFLTKSLQTIDHFCNKLPQIKTLLTLEANETFCQVFKVNFWSNLSKTRQLFFPPFFRFTYNWSLLQALSFHKNFKLTNLEVVWSITSTANQQCWCYATIVNTSPIELIDVQSETSNGESKFDLVEFPNEQESII